MREEDNNQKGELWIPLWMLGTISGIISAAGLFIPAILLIPEGYLWAPGLAYGFIVVIPALRRYRVSRVLFLPAIIASVLAYYVAFCIQFDVGHQAAVYMAATALSGLVGSALLGMALILLSCFRIRVIKFILYGTIAGSVFGLLIVWVDTWTLKMFVGFILWQTATSYALEMPDKNE